MEKIAPCEVVENIWFRLSKAAKEDLAKSAISTDYQAKMACVDISTNEEVEEILGHPDFPKGSGKSLLSQTKVYVIRYPDGYRRLKLLNPIATNTGTVKYLSPSGEKESNPFHLYYLPEYAERLKKRGVIVWTEGEKKAIAVQQWLDKEGFKNAIAIGIPGITMWRGCLQKISANAMTFSGRKHFIAFDYKDISEENTDVQREAFGLCLELHRRKANSVEFFSWPEEHKGIDDYLATRDKKESPLKTMMKESSKNPFEFLSLLSQPISGITMAINCFAKSHLTKDTVEQIYKEYDLATLYSHSFANFYKKIVQLFEQKQEKETPTTKWSAIIKTIPTNKTGINYIVTPEGIFKHVNNDHEGHYYDRICIDPILLTELVQDIITGTCYVKLLCRNEKYLVSTTALSGNGLAEITALGLAILKPNAQDMASYFLACWENLKADATAIKKYSTRQGWKSSTDGESDCESFILGDKLITANGTEQLAQNLLKATPIFLRKGDMETWQNEMKKWTEDPQIQIILGASISSPLLLPLAIEGKTIHLFGESSTSKSTAAKIAASIWGKPFGENPIISNWLASRCGAEVLFNTVNNLPAFLEDSQLAEKEYVFQTVMLYGNGSGRPRGNVDLQSAKKTSWCGHCISTGERAISDVSNYGGCTTRSIEIIKKKYKTYTETDFSILRMTLRDNYGFGDEVIRYWFQNKTNIINQYHSLLDSLGKYFSNINDDTKKTRAVSNLAIIAVGTWIGNHIWGFHYDLNAIIKEFSKVLQHRPSVGAEKLYEELCSLQQSMSDRVGEMAVKEGRNGYKRYYYNGKGGFPVKNELAIYHPGLNVLCFYPSQLETYLNSRNYGLSLVTDILTEKGLLIKDDDGKQFKLSINGKKVRFYALKLPDNEDESVNDLPIQNQNMVASI